MMRRKTMLSLKFAAACTALSLSAVPAFAQDKASGADLDSIIDSSNDPTGALRLAREQSDTGHLIAAAATLERALLARTRTDTTPVRLYYVATLCRLDDRARALIELDKVDGSRVADADWSDTMAPCGPIARPAASAHGSGTGNSLVGQVAVGMAYDTDAQGALAVVFDFPGITGVSDDDFSFIGSAQLDGRLGLGQGYLYGGLDAQTKDALGSSGLDYQIGTARIGYGRQLDAVGFSFGGVVQHARLNGAAFVTEYGGQGQVVLPTGRTGRITLRGEGMHQDYTGSFPFFSRDGTRYDLAFDYRATRRRADWIIGAAFEDKVADTAYLGYRGVRFYSAFRQPIGHGGTYIGTSSIIRFVDFRDAPFVNDRQETRFYTRALIGHPIARSGFDVEAAVTHTRRDYNKSSFLRDYDSFGFEVQLVWNFGK